MKAYLLENQSFETTFQSAKTTSFITALVHCVADLQPTVGVEFEESRNFVSAIRSSLQYDSQLEAWEETVSIGINTPIQNMMVVNDLRCLPPVTSQVQVNGPFLDDLLCKYNELIKMKILMKFSSFRVGSRIMELFPSFNVESNEMICSQNGTQQGFTFEEELLVTWPVVVSEGLHVSGTVTLEIIGCPNASSNEDLCKAFQLLCFKM
ncbi:hypothetical protein Ocin01_16953 [Orchesella cincta]|uniref:Uncharacterized protein n=1 Tax=Orchesella cincta TaxID=48709 RepID=A0A1D2M9W8_ORCCI|nr:hypothetical protein Ocin01_16953 [Orchesella cincta]